MAERVAGLALGNGAEQGGDVRVALDVRLLGEVEVAAVGLALAGERLFQVGLGLAVLESWHGWSFLVVDDWSYVGWADVGAVLSHQARRVPEVAAVTGAPGRSRQDGHRPRKTTSAEPTSKPRSAPSGNGQVGKVDDQVADAAAAPAHQMVVGVVDVGVEAGHAGADVESGDLSQFGQIVERLVDGLEGDGLHLPHGRGVHGLGRRMGLVTLEDPEDALALGRDLAPGRPEQISQLFGRPHPRQCITSSCQTTIIVDIYRRTDDHRPC